MADGFRLRILGVLVLYRCRLDDAVAWRGLAAQMTPRLAAGIDLPFDFQLLVCDNGPLPEHAPHLPKWVEYVGIAANQGLAWAYNLGLARAKECGADWLLTLDQDTALPADFLVRMTARIVDLGPREASLVPLLVGEEGRVYSPSVVRGSGERVLPKGFQGVCAGEMRAYNSAAFLRVEVLTAIGGYDRRFWLDYLDHALFRVLYQRGLRVWVEGEMQILHRLSLQEDRATLRGERFHNFSYAESAFRDLHSSCIEGALFTFRLCLRALNQKKRRDPAHFFETTLAVLKQRLTLSRRERLRRWEQEVAPMAAEPAVALRSPELQA